MKYNNSTLRLFSSLFPDYNWLPWKFSYCPQSNWEDEKIVRKFMEHATKELNIKEMSDWYKVTIKVTINSVFSLKFRK
jgi:predicted small metal-binding protein